MILSDNKEGWLPNWLIDSCLTSIWAVFPVILAIRVWFKVDYRFTIISYDGLDVNYLIFKWCLEPSVLSSRMNFIHLTINFVPPILNILCIMLKIIVLYNNTVRMVICDGWYLHLHVGNMILTISQGEDKGNMSILPISMDITFKC